MKRMYTAVLLGLALATGCTGDGDGMADPPVDRQTRGAVSGNFRESACTFELRVNARRVAAWEPLRGEEEDAEHAWRPEAIGLSVFPAEIVAFAGGGPAESLTINGVGLTYREDIDAPGFYQVVVRSNSCEANGNVEFYCDSGPRPEECKPIPR